MGRALKEVFTPGGQPSVTYVGREHLGLEDRVSDALARGYAINVVTGPTKSGKTVLCNHVLTQTGNCVTVQGGQVRNEADFWAQISSALEFGTSRTRKYSGTEKDSVGTEASLGFKAILNLGTKSELDSSRTSERSITYEVVPVRQSIEGLLQTSTSLLVDDFHYIPSGVQKAIIQALKGAVFEGLSVILLAVPHRAFDPITVEDELQGRFKHVEIPPWDLSDLLLIPERGFAALNIDVNSKFNKTVCAEGFANPLLVQEICSEFCLKNKIYNECDILTAPDFELLNVALGEIAQSKGFPKYSKLKAGPEAHKERQARAFKDGTAHDKYSAIMEAIAANGPKPRTSYDEIRTALRSLLVEASMPAKHEITAALAHMSKIAKEKIIGEPPLEWVGAEDALVITDPFLMFYMKWATNQSAPGSHLPSLV